MGRAQSGYVQFLCEEFGERFDDTLTQGQAAQVIDSFLNEPMTEGQRRTVEYLSRKAGRAIEYTLTYGEARDRIRQLLLTRSSMRSA